MMDRLRAVLPAVAAALATAAPAQPGAAPLPRALAGLEAGAWDLVESPPNGPRSRVCVRNLRQLLQPRHSSLQCRQYVAEETPDRVAVSYDCGANGQGRTVLRVETPRLIQIESQGVENGGPFALRLEGRRAGSCTVAAAR